MLILPPLPYVATIDLSPDSAHVILSIKTEAFTRSQRSDGVSHGEREHATYFDSVAVSDLDQFQGYHEWVMRYLIWQAEQRLVASLDRSVVCAGTITDIEALPYV